MTGNAYWGRSSSGFCGVTAGAFTNVRADVTCADCLDRIA